MDCLTSLPNIGFRLTIRNVNTPIPPNTVGDLKSFRLTIRNVNNEEFKYIHVIDFVLD